MAFTLPALPFAFDALEPHIDTQTMQIHHGKHHQAYVDNLNKAIAGTPNENKSLEELVAAAGSISPDGGGKPSGKLADAINETFGSLEALQEKINTAGTTRFGSGWAWLIVRDG